MGNDAAATTGRRRRSRDSSSSSSSSQSTSRTFRPRRARRVSAAAAASILLVSRHHHHSLPVLHDTGGGGGSSGSSGSPACGTSGRSPETSRCYRGRWRWSWSGIAAADAFVVGQPSPIQRARTANGGYYTGGPTCTCTTASSQSPTALHGIKGFRAWFESTFPNAVVPLPRSRSRDPNNNHVDTFDHVLIDVNQLLHVSLRRAPHDPTHALFLLIKELDRLLLNTARPTKSVVLAFDGPPSAAKLATQRQRRYGMLQRGEVHKRTLEFLAKRGVIGSDHEELRGLAVDDLRELGIDVVEGVNFAANGADDGDDDDGAYGNGERGQLGPNGARNERAEHNNKFKRGKENKLERKQKKERTKRERHARDESTLAITPGTAFLTRAERALLYWAWQRLSSRRGPLSNVRVYLSPSAVPGEGEVKLLDWLRQMGGDGGGTGGAGGGGGGRGAGSGDGRRHFQVVQPGHSVAIMGGDSDLVVEGLIIPPSITHNVFVILPHDGNTNVSYCISLWETTRTLARYLPNLDDADIVRVRTDLVLLLIMNGNDYLPKLRGSSGFDRLFHTYLRLLRRWLDDDNTNLNPEHALHKSGTDRPRPFLVDPDTLELNVPFCLAFFRRLARTEPNLASADHMVDWRRSSVTPLSQLNNLVEAGFLPRPIEWETLSEAAGASVPVEEETDHEEEDVRVNGDGATNNAVEVADTETKAKKEEEKAPSENEEESSRDIFRLTLGRAPPGSGGNRNGKGMTDGVGSNGANSGAGYRYYRFEVPHRHGKPLQKTKQLLAGMALEDLLGKDYMDMPDYVLGNDVDGDEDDGDEDDDNDDELAEGMLNLGSPSSMGYDWEAEAPAACQVESYLEGLLWNLQTYQDGVCANYAYNYGAGRMSPSASEIVDYLKDASDANDGGAIVGPRELLAGKPFVPALPAGMSCLAALPQQVSHLIPEPFRRLTVNDTVEEIYASCMEPEANVFDMDMFRRLCTERLDEMEAKGEMAGTDYANYDAGHGEKGRGNPDTSSGPEVGGGRPRQHYDQEPPQGRKIRTGSKFWTVLYKARDPLARPFSPPEPFSDRLDPLRPHRRLVASRMMATEEPTRFSAKGEEPRKEKVHGSPTHRKMEQERRREDNPTGNDSFPGGEVSRCDMTRVLTNLLGQRQTIEDVGYKKAYTRAKHESAQQRRTRRPIMDIPPAVGGSSSIGAQEGDPKASKKKHRHRLADEAARMKLFKMVPPPEEPKTNVDGQTPVTLIRQLQDIKLLDLRWELTMPSRSDYASTNPELHETVRLILDRAPDNDEGSSSSIVSSEIVFEQDRNINFVSRKVMRQHLASLALNELCGGPKCWTETTFKEMKGHLISMARTHARQLND